VYDQQLRSRFEWLREPAPDAVATPAICMAFDLLYCDGRNLSVEHQVRADSLVIAAATPAPLRVVHAVAADEPDVVAVLVGEDTLPVHLLLEHPAVAEERLADKRRSLRDHELHSTLRRDGPALRYARPSLRSRSIMSAMASSRERPAPSLRCTPFPLVPPCTSYPRFSMHLPNR
jgi:hypothetical protein